MPGNVKWSLLGSLLVYLALFVTRNTRFEFSSRTLTAAKNMCRGADNRRVDISDSRLSNFDSESSDRELGSSDMLAVDRVFPLTRTLNWVMDNLCRKFALYVVLENKKILSLKNNFLNLTFFEDENNNETERNVFGKNAIVSRLDSLQRLGNAYIAEDTDTSIVIVQRLQFKILKHSFDFYDNNSTYLGGSSFIYNKNTFLLNITLSTTYDNSECMIKNVNFTYLPDRKYLILRVEGLSGTTHFYNKLKSILYENFISKVSSAIENELLPILTNLVHQAHICSYFDAKDKKSINRHLVNANNFNYLHSQLIA